MRSNPSKIVKYDKENCFFLEEKKKYVKQGHIKVEYFEKEDPSQILLYTKGMNPCMGIILKGTIQCKIDDDNISKENFVVLHHHQDHMLKKPDDIVELSKEIREYAKNIILTTMINIIDEEISQEYDDDQIKITLSKSFLIRCQQTDKDNSQEQVAAEFKKILESKKNMLELAEGSINLCLAKKYDFLVEEAKETAQSDIDCYIKKEKNSSSISVIIPSAKEKVQKKRKMSYFNPACSPLKAKTVTPVSTYFDTNVIQPSKISK